MKLPSLLPSLSALLITYFMFLPEAEAQKGLLILGQPFQYVDFTYSLQNQNTYPKSGASSSIYINRLIPGYTISVPFAVYDPDIFVGGMNLSIKYEHDFISSSSGQSGNDSSTTLQYGVSGTLMRRKPATLSFYANSQKSWIQQEFAPGNDVTTTNYGALTEYKHDIIPVKVRYDHNGSEYNNGNGDQKYDYDTLQVQLSHSAHRSMQSSVIVQDRWTRNTTGPFQKETFLDDLSINFNNSLQWEFDRYTPGSLSTAFFYDKMTGDSQVTSHQLTESFSQSLGQALKSGAQYGYSLQESPLETVESHTGNIWLTHQLFQSLRTLINAQGSSIEFAQGSRKQLIGTGELVYEKRLPHNSAMQLTLSDTYQWNKQDSGTQIRTQINEEIKIKDIAQRYLLANTNVFTIVEVWNKDHTIMYNGPADFGTEVVGDLTYITINPTGLIHSGDVIVVTYQYHVDTELTTGANTVSVSGNLSLVGNLCRFFGGYSNTQHELLSGRATYASLGNSSSWNAGAESTIGSHTFGIRYDASDNTRLSQDSLYSYWWYSRSLGNNRYSLTVSDTYSTWHDKITLRDGDSNIFNMWGTITRQFTPGSQGTAKLGYLMARDSRESNNVYLGLNYTMRIGKLQFLFNAQSQFSDTMKVSTWNNYVNLVVRRYFY